jgi:hypothetical protein
MSNQEQAQTDGQTTQVRANLQANAGSDSKKPYGEDTQVLVVSVHGTINNPRDVRPIANMIGRSLEDNYSGRVVTNTNFTWDANAGNNGDSRGVASGQLSRHVMRELNDAYRTGTLDPNKPLVVQLVGFSHGGNVALQAADDISEALRRQSESRGRPLNAAIHVATLSTPAYQDGTAGRGAQGEDPRFAAARVSEDGVRFAHSHVHVRGDSVVTTVAGGSSTYAEIGQGGVTRNLILPQLNWNLVDNHGAPQNSAEHMRRTADFIDTRHQGLAPNNNNRISDAGQPGDSKTALALETDTTRNMTATVSTTDAKHIQRTLVDGSPELNRQFAQALQAIETTNAPNTRDLAASAVQVISQAPGYKIDQDISIVQSKNGGFIVSQGEGATAINLAVPQAKQGDFERISTQMAQQPPTQLALGQAEKQEHKSLSM